MPVTRYFLEVEPLPSDHRPPELRLRAMQRIALRALGLRCMVIHPTDNNSARIGDVTIVQPDSSIDGGVRN